MKLVGQSKLTVNKIVFYTESNLYLLSAHSKSYGFSFRHRNFNMWTKIAFLGIAMISTINAQAGPGGTSLGDHGHGSVAFSVGLSRTMHIANAETVTFDKVFSNLASAYSEHTGIFKCPQSGMYVFHLHAYDMNTDKAMWLELKKNNELLVSISGYDSHATAGNTVLVHLNRGDTVYVKARQGQEFSLFGRNDEIYATFTGYKVSDASYQAPPAPDQDPFAFLNGRRR